MTLNDIKIQTKSSSLSIVSSSSVTSILVGLNSSSVLNRSTFIDFLRRDNKYISKY